MEIKKEYEPFMSEIFRSLPETFFIKDTEGRYAFTTRICDFLNAGPDGTIIGKKDYEIQFDKQLGMRYYKEDMEIISKGISTRTVDTFQLDGKTTYLEVIKNPIYNDENEIIGICGICNDITELITLREKYEQLSLYDSLTGLYNRNYIAKFDFDNESSLPCSYIICDCNNLKMINDRYGHKAGDRYICEAADMLKRIVPEKSAVIRWGGDEFLIVTPVCSKTAHEEIITNIKAESKKFSDAESHIGLAVGGALRLKPDIEEAEILKAADQEMYQNKTSHKQSVSKYRLNEFKEEYIKFWSKIL